MVRLLIVVVLGLAAFFGLRYFTIHAGGITFAQLLLDSNVIVKMVCILLNLVAVSAVLLGVISLFDRSGATRTFLKVVTWTAPGLGLLGAAYGVMVIMAGLKGIDGPVDSRVWAPSAAEAVMPLVFGFWAASIAALFLLKKPPSAKAAPT